jgi:hypothetical protein
MFLSKIGKNIKKIGKISIFRQKINCLKQAQIGPYKLKVNESQLKLLKVDNIKSDWLSLN